MKFLAILLVLFPLVAHADMAEVDVGFGQGTKPFYGADYEVDRGGWPYLDFSLTGNAEYVQPYFSFGLQFEHINFGLAQAITFSRTDGSASYGIGPEVGYMQNLNSLVYIKEGNSLLRSNGSFNFSSTFSIGLNL